MMGLTKIVIFGVILLLAVSCGEDTFDVIPCDAQPTISQTLFEAVSPPVTIISASILTDCLEIQFSYFGCSDQVQIELAVSEQVSGTDPPRRAMRVFLTEDGNCNITQGQMVKIDLRLLQVVNTSRLYLDLEGWDEPLIYGY